MNRIKILAPHEARRIAAGEVIERPASALRELIDNAIDAKATQITIHLQAGGIEEITIIDNGIGMSKDDLALCIISHATSKITKVEDLDSLSTLGFRGEALASLAACAKLEITSKTLNDHAHQLLVHDGTLQSITPSAHPVGTTIRIKELFYSIPVRKRFLKSPASESRESLQVIYEKALAHPHVAFTVIMDGKPKLQLLASTLAQRVMALYPQQLGDSPIVAFSENHTTDGFSLQIIASPPHLYRNDKRFIHFYANNRRIIEYAPIQALLHAYDKILPGGQYPSGFIFAQIRPDLIDFNIHPAKREAKFRNLPMIHKAIIHLLSPHLLPIANKEPEKSIFRSLPLQTPSLPMPTPEQYPSHKNVASTKKIPHPHSYSRLTHGDPIASFLPKSPPDEGNIPKTLETKDVREVDYLEQKSRISGNLTQSWYYLGQIFGVFLLVEKGDSLYLIDQHAAHERIRFDEICASPPAIERLLTPLSLEVTPDQMLLINLTKDELNAMGIEFEVMDEEHIALLSCPSTGNSVAFWQEYILNVEKGLKKTLYATMACRSAIKEGEFLDDNAALTLIKQTFAIQDPFCPHGRPLWIQLSREQLYRWIKRIV